MNYRVCVAVFRVALIAAAMSLCGSVAAAQTVRGIVTMNAGDVPARGTVVTLERASIDSSLVERSTLTSSAGAYAIRAPGSGTYRIVARRIGSLPFRSEPFPLAVGQVHVLDFAMVLAARYDVSAALGTIIVRRATPCVRGTSGARIATLWEDARTALLSSEIAMRERLVSSRQVRYKREIDLPLMEIRTETFTAFDAEDAGGQTSFRSLPADSLSRDGYWQLTKPGVTVFYGPDANALLSETFVRDHCFALVDSVVNSDTLTGLTFVPVESRLRLRAPPDIRGTIWFTDGASLSRVEFMWTKLTGNTGHLGGEVHYARIGDGPWVVNSWRFRMPQEVVVRLSQAVTQRTGIVEEGGLTLPDSIDWSTANATVQGIINQPNGRPLAGARVRILGTPVEAESGTDGRFTLDGVPQGLQYVVADHESVSMFGVRLGQTALLIDSGATRSLTFTAPTPAQLAESLCAGSPSHRDRGVLRVVVRDSANGRPVQASRVRLFVKGDENASVADVSSASTDLQGAVVFCNVITDKVLVVNTASASQELVIRRGEVVARVLTVGGRAYFQ